MLRVKVYCRGGGTHAILRHIVGGDIGGRGSGWRGGEWGEGESKRTGLNTHVAKLPTEFVEDSAGPLSSIRATALALYFLLSIVFLPKPRCKKNVEKRALIPDGNATT